jgi:phage-related baseplate assembly protein
MPDKVQFLSTDPDAVLAALVNDYQAASGKVLQPGQAEQIILQATANRLTENRIAINETANQNLVDFAIAPGLDYLGALLGVTRLTATSAICIIRFTLVTGHGPINIPSGIRIQSIDGQLIFITTESISVSPDDDTADVAAACTTTGTKGNDYVAGNISVILDPQAYVSAAANTDTTNGGSDPETDEELRARIKLAPAVFSVAGPKDAYNYWAKTASPLIIDVQTLGPEDGYSPGDVHIFLLLQNGASPSTELIDEVKAVVNNEKIRPLNDTVFVAGATQINYAITINLVLLTTAVQDDVLAAINANLDTYINTRKSKLGIDVVKSQLIKCAMVDGVYSAAIVSPSADITVAKNEFTNQTARTLVVTGTSDE